MIPAWLLDILAAVMLGVVALTATRLVAARPWRQPARRAVLADVDVAHLLIALAMAGMLAAGLKTLPGGAWEVIFGVLAAWFASRVVLDARVIGVRALAGRYCAPHLVHAACMLYVVLAVARAAGGSGMGGMGSLGLPALAFVFALLLIGYGIWDLDQLSGPGTAGHYSLATARAGGSAVAAASRVPPAGLGGQGGGAGVLAPWVATGCRIVVGVTMAFMLLIMI